MQDTNLPSLFCGTAQDSKDSSNSRKKKYLETNLVYGCKSNHIIGLSSFNS
ncbi:hypothetical protein YC2023_112296 [Brassica napus]